MAQHYDQDGFKGARHLSHRDIPIGSVVSSALKGLSDTFPTPPISDDPPTGSPITSVSLPNVPPTSLPIPSVSLPLPTSLPPSDANSTDSSSVSTPSAADTNPTSSPSPSPSSPSSSSISSNSVSNIRESGDSTSLPSSSFHESSNTPPFSSHPVSAIFTNTGSSTITEVFTTTSGSLTLAVTTTLLPSLSSNPGSDSTFFKNKGQAAAVLTVLILMGILGFGFLGYRFVKTVKKRQLERDLQEATRLNRSRAILDDEDDENIYATDSTRQTESSIWSASQPISAKPSLDWYAASMHSMSALGNSTVAGQSSFEATHPSRVVRRRASTEDDVLPTNTNESVSRAYINETVSGTGSIPGGSHVYGLQTSHSGQNPFATQLQLPMSPLLPEFFGEGTELRNAVLSNTLLGDGQDDSHSAQST